MYSYRTWEYIQRATAGQHIQWGSRHICRNFEQTSGDTAALWTLSAVISLVFQHNVCLLRSSAKSAGILLLICRSCGTVRYCHYIQWAIMQCKHSFSALWWFPPLGWYNSLSTNRYILIAALCNPFVGKETWNSPQSGPHTGYSAAFHTKWTIKLNYCESAAGVDQAPVTSSLGHCSQHRHHSWPLSMRNQGLALPKLFNPVRKPWINVVWT